MLLLDKTLLRLSKGLWGWMLAIVFVRIVNLVAITQFAYIIGNFLQQLLNPNMTFQQAKSAILSAFIVSLLMFITQVIQAELEYRCSAKARTSLRNIIFDKVLKLRLSDVEKISPVSIITSTTDAIEQIQVYYSTYLPSLIFSFLAPIYLYMRLKDISYFVAGILLCVSFVLLPLHNVFRSKIEHLRKSYWNSVEDMTAYFLDSIRGLITLKLFEQDKQHASILSEKAEKLNADINAFMKINFTSFLVTEGLIYASIVVVLVLICSDLQSGIITIGTALTVFLLSYSFFTSMKQLMMATHNALTAVSAAYKIETVLQTDTSRPYEINATKDQTHFDGIRFENVSFRYDKRKDTLHNISLTIPKGSVCALAGMSGCGKSTIASLMMRFLDASSGRMYIEGEDYIALKPEEIRQKVMMVPQTVSIFHGTIKDNLLFAKSDATDAELYDVLEKVKLKDFIDSLQDGIYTDVGDSGSRLSGGQKQKIGIARALLTNAQYIIFDEATSAVDRESEEEIWKCIESLADTKTLIIISHRLSTIAHCDTIYVLNKGEIIERGTHEELLEKKGLYATLVQQQSKMEAYTL